MQDRADKEDLQLVQGLLLAEEVATQETEVRLGECQDRQCTFHEGQHLGTGGSADVQGHQ